jgi:hypothetical protein
MRMDMQAAQYMGVRAPITAGITTTTPTPPPLPYIFDTLDEAETSLMHEHATILHFARTTASKYKYHSPGGVPLDLIVQTHSFETRLSHWKSAFTYSYSCQKARNSSPRVSARTALILIQYYIARITAATCLYAEETLYDRFLPEFRHIVALAGSSCIASTQDATCTQGDLPLIGLPISTGAIHPLYFVATKCRDATVRFEAIDLLSEIARCPDSVWEGCILAAVAKRARDVEEAAPAPRAVAVPGVACANAPGDQDQKAIPEFRRIHVLGLDIRRDVRKVRVEFRRRSNGMDGDWEEWEEEISW